MAWVTDIASQTLANPYYRDVLYTGTLQVVLMSLEPGEDIPVEKHPGDQFIQVEAGHGQLVLTGEIVDLSPGVTVVIPKNRYHYIKPLGSKPLQFYTIYAPPTHDEAEREARQP